MNDTVIATNEITTLNKMREALRELMDSGHTCECFSLDMREIFTQVHNTHSKHARTIKIAEEKQQRIVDNPIAEHEHLIDYCAGKNLNMSVYSNMGTRSHHEIKPEDIKRLVSTLPECTLRVTKPSFPFEFVTVANITPYSDSHETLTSYSNNNFMYEWRKVYDQTISAYTSEK